MPTPDPGRPQPALLTAWSDEPAVMGLLEVNLGDIESLVRLALDRRASHERLEHLAHHDPLTGLANRASFFNQLATAVQGTAPLGVAYLDLDGFKGANDRHGHAAGDEVLVELGRRFSREIRASDAVARLGGDEFGVMLSDPQSEAAASAVVERLLAAARRPIALATGAEVTLGASAGLVVVDDPRGSTPDALIHQADTALYRAKRNAKGTLELARPGDDAKRRRDDPA
jgi:diguanylate cyclase (GGDEF)-like protein